ncbi:MAG: hypothetical protein LC624_06555 [Halobacteriales archaeon]|nr:hypothetical protein [Halobacteriales archaeon]
MRLLALGIAPALALVLLAGCAAPTGPRPGNDTPQPGPDTTITLPTKFLHEHAAWSMFLLGEQVDFTDPAYDLFYVRNISAHLHVQEEHGGSIVHIEGNFTDGVPDVTLQSFLATLGVRFPGPSLTLDTKDGHNGTTWNDTATLRWRVLVGDASGNGTVWRDAPEGPLLPLRDGVRVLLTYGAPEQDIAAQGQAVPFPPKPRQATQQPA